MGQGPRAAVIYARISQDRAGEGLGVARQLQDCRAEAERRGWPVVAEYVDDDLSAYSGKARPAYERVLEAISEGEADAVLVWHMDRLHRRPIELEEFAQVCSRAGVDSVVTLNGDVNLANGDGLLMARLLAAVAANESDAKSRRQARKMRELAEHGKPHGGGVRPFGFNDDRVTLNTAEAEVIAQLARRLLAGEPLVSLTRWLDETGVRTVTGRPWRTVTVRQLLLRPRIAGLREHQGQVIGKATWPAIIPEPTYQQVVALLTDPARRTNRTARTYLLSGLCRCGRCGAKMVTARDRGRRRYLCRSGVDFGGCGRTTVTADPVEELLARAVLHRLDSPDLARALTGRHADDETAAALSESITADTAQLEELAALWASKSITASEWMTARKEIEARRTANRRRQAQQAGTPVLAGYIGQGSALAQQWPDLNLDVRPRSCARWSTTSRSTPASKVHEALTPPGSRFTGGCEARSCPSSALARRAGGPALPPNSDTT
ncbi:recombinase family protein [Janibacter anophelis]|uniref:recombinase family protein n=1 Tax=Janibacter anophelis TaxID=319054 RepID=UPI003F81D1C0